MFSLEQLRAFVAVAEHLHFGKAAQALQMTQPPLSRQIQRLEVDLGVDLLVRSNRRVELTQPGIAFLDRARAILDLADNAKVVARSAARGERGRVEVGFTSGGALSFLEPLLEHWESALPGVEIGLTEGVSSAQLHELDRYRLDIALIRTPPTDDEHGSAVVASEDLILAMPSAHRLAGGGAVALDELVGEDLIGYTAPESAYFKRRAETLLGGRDVRTRFAVSQVLSMISLVAGGLGVAIVPRSTTRLGIDGVAFADLDVPAALQRVAQVSVHAVWRLDSRNPVVPPAVDALRAFAARAR